MVAVQPLVSEFTIIGKLEEFVVNGKNRLKYLYLSTEAKDYSIKVAKSPKNLLSLDLKSGCYLKVTGMRKYELHQDQLEYTAYKIELLPEQLDTPTITPKVKASHQTVKVLFCQSPNCWKKGGKAACALLQNELCSQGILDRVEIKTTGCMKQCKQAPNLVIMPGRNRYSGVQPEQLSALIAKQLDIADSNYQKAN